MDSIINRRKVFQACGATSAPPETHVRIANTLPGLMTHIDRNGEYDTSETSVRRAMKVVGVSSDDSAYYNAVVGVIGWMQQHGGLPAPSSKTLEALAEEYGKLGTGEGDKQHTEGDAPNGDDEPNLSGGDPPAPTGGTDVEEGATKARKSRKS